MCGLLSACGGGNGDNSATSEPGPVAATSPGGTKIAIATSAENLALLKMAVADMGLNHEVVPAGVGTNVGWKYKPAVAMGTEPYGSSIGSWWPGTKFPQWRGMVTWFVIYPGEGGNPASNSAVEVSGLELWYYSARDKDWHQVQAAQLPSWAGAVAQNAVNSSPTPAYLDVTATTVKYAPSSDNMVHGGLSQTQTPWNDTTGLADIDAFVALVRHRLVLKNSSGQDDRATANLALQTGVDYYPFVGAKVSDLNASYVPAAALGRFIKVNTNWRYSTVFVRSGRLTEAQMLATAPPFFAYLLGCHGCYQPS